MAWLISVALALWSIWLMRNDVVFNGKADIVNDIMFFSKLRALMWIKVTPSIVLCGEAKWWFDPRGCFKIGFLGCHNLLQDKELLAIFHVHGAFADSKVAYRGVLFNKGVIRAIFSGPASCENRLSAGLVAAKTTLEIFIAAGWANWCPLVLASDCKVLVNLIENSLQRPWALSKFFAEFDNLSCVCKLIQFRYIKRVENEMTTRLAFDGFSRRDCFKAWW
ncbi:hypothetical protein V6N13_032685 [Hibiscus sabdariffa]